LEIKLDGWPVTDDRPQAEHTELPAKRRWMPRVDLMSLLVVRAEGGYGGRGGKRRIEREKERKREGDTE
jgi:hypothetical protein